MARWQNGDVEDCKSSNAGSIPARASSEIFYILNLDRVTEIASDEARRLKTQHFRDDISVLMSDIWHGHITKTKFISF